MDTPTATPPAKTFERYSDLLRYAAEHLEKDQAQREHFFCAWIMRLLQTAYPEDCAALGPESAPTGASGWMYDPKLVMAHTSLPGVLRFVDQIMEKHAEEMTEEAREPSFKSYVYESVDQVFAFLTPGNVRRFIWNEWFVLNALHSLVRMTGPDAIESVCNGSWSWCDDDDLRMTISVGHGRKMVFYRSSELPQLLRMRIEGPLGDSSSVKEEKAKDESEQE